MSAGVGVGVGAGADAGADGGARMGRPGPAAPALEVRGLVRRFGATEVLRGVELALRPGERLALIGPNGAGKTTLFELLSGRLRPDAGRIHLGGRRIDGLPPHAVARAGVGRSHQTSRLFARLSVAEHLRAALLPPGAGRVFWRPAPAHPPGLDDWLRRLRLEDRAAVPVAALAPAEQRRLEIGLAAAGGAGLLLLDEPTAGMGRAETAEAVALIRTLSAGRTLLLVEHDMAVVFDLADRIAVLVEGRVIACDTPARVRADPRVQRAYLGSALAGAA